VRCSRGAGRTLLAVFGARSLRHLRLSLFFFGQFHTIQKLVKI
jgi:hypothetical protein